MAKKTCSRCLMNTDIPSVIIHKDGECNFCKINDRLEAESTTFDFNGFVDKLRKKNVKYHCLIGISGGIDSSFLLEYTVNTLKLRPLIIHFDNGWNCKESNHNIEVMVKALNVDFIRYSINQQEYDDICKSFLLASVSDADIPNDMAMSYFMMKTANDYGIKWIFNGHDYKREGTSPLCFSYMDARYIQSVHATITGKPIKSFPLLTFSMQLLYALKGIRHIRPLYYIDYNPEREKQRLTSRYGWKDYGAKHSENDYTWFVGAYLLPTKFGIDKRITYLSALMRNGWTTREEAESVMESSTMRGLKDYLIIEDVQKRLGLNGREFAEIMRQKRHYFTEFKTYKSEFRRWKWLLWIGVKLRVFPYLFYKKYTT